LKTHYAPRGFFAIVFLASSAHAADNAATFYVGRISSVNAWHDLITAPADAEFVDAYVAVAAVSHVVSRHLNDRASFEVEGQVGYNFGDQSHWEFNAAYGPRWRSFPWNDSVKTTAAFLVGLSYATEVPEVEVVLEDDSAKTLIHWSAELTFGPPRSAWTISMRLHHRSPAFGLFTDEGGVNALALGWQIEF
jgi:hypothetical protein